MEGKRKQAVEACVRRLAPRAPDRDVAEVVGHALWSAGLKTASAEAAAWLSLVAYVRHNFTDYDVLLAEGYGDEAARHFCLGEMEAVLRGWGVRKGMGVAF